MMKLTFLGTGTSMGVPVAGGFGANNFSPDPRNIRTRCSAWITTNETSLLIDAGPEFRIQSIRAHLNRVDAVLITHQHMDHISGIDDLRAFNFVQKKTIPVYSSQECIDSIKSRFDYMFGEDKYEGATSIELNEISQKTDFKDLSITPLPCTHGSLKILGFRVNDISYLTDVKHIPQETKELIKGSKVIVLSGLRWEPEHPTHLTIPEAVDIIEELGIPKGYLIHMNSYVDHEQTNRKLPEHIKLAYDQQVIEID